MVEVISVDAAVRILVALLLLTGVSVAVLRGARVKEQWASPVAVLRAVVQLGIVAFLLRGVITSPFWVGVALAVMFGVAASTSARRLGFTWARLLVIAGAMIAGVVVATSIVFATGAVEFSPRYVLALGGIVIGNSMSIATLAGRRLYQDAHQRWDEVEGWLSVGATPRQATATIRRAAIHEALIPSLDQTRTVGLVTLPGTFVGAIFGGASPIEAGIFQVIVLASVLTSGAITSTLLMTALAAIQSKPAP